MNRLIEISLSGPAGPTTFALLVEAVVKGTAVLALAALLAFVLQRTSAARRHLIWACALGVLALMPALLLVLPAWTVRSTTLSWVTVPNAIIEPEVIAPNTEGARTLATMEGPSAPNATIQDGDAGAGASIARVEPVRSPVAEREVRAPIDWRVLAAVVWALGALVVALIFASGHLVLRTLLRDARRLRSGEWHDLALEAADRLRLSLPFALLQSSRVPVPVAFGLFRPRVLLPLEADEWSVDRRRSVLLHELAHVQRHDCLTQAIAQLACALFWFHPAVWWVAARMRVERERACDDRVLAARTVPSDYADHLLDVVRSLRATRLAALGAVAFARRSSLEGRLIAVLDPARDRSAVRFRGGLLAMAVASIVVLPLAAIEPARVHAGSKHREEANETRVSRSKEALPSRVERPTDAEGSLDAGIAWARADARARADREYWIGWRIGTTSKLKGGLLGDTEGIDIDWLSAEGAFTLDDVLAGREAGTSNMERRTGDDRRPVALLVRTSGGSLSRVRVQSLELPAEFGGEPLYWLDTIPTEQTFDWLKAEAARTREVKLRARLVESVGYLDRSDLVLPFLQATLDGDDVAQVRAGAAEAIGRHPSPDALRQLVEHAKEDPSHEVRRASVEALGRFQTPEALEALLAMARADEAGGDTRRQVLDVFEEEIQNQAGDEGKREKAKFSKHAEKLAMKEAKQDAKMREWDPGPPDEPSMKMDPAEHEVQRQAIEALGHYPETQSLQRLKRIAETSPNADLRRQAVESIGRIGTPGAISVLQEVVWRNRQSLARMTAIHMLARLLPEDEALDRLETIAATHSSMDTRRVAVEMIGRFDGPRAVDLLERTLERGPDREAQRQAVESLGRRDGHGIDERLFAIAKSHPVQDVRRQAAEMIGRRGSRDALDRLLSLIHDEVPEDVRRQAVESIGRLEDSRVKATLLEIVRRGPSGEATRQAVESLGRIEEDTMPELADLARSHPSGEVRRQAVESMTRRDPDRALPILEEILKQPKRRTGA